MVNPVKKAYKEADVATKSDLRELEYRLKISLGTMLAIAVSIMAVLIKVL